MTPTSVVWSEDGRKVSYSVGQKSWTLDILTGQVVEGALPPRGNGNGRPDRRPRPERGRQFSSTTSSDGKLKATSKGGNIIVGNADGTGAQVPITSDGGQNRIKYGVASWVYGEELGVLDAMWFSNDSQYLAYYRFDESPVLDYFLAMDQRKVQARLDVEAYPKAGTQNPIVGLLVYRIGGGGVTPIETNFDSGAGPNMGEYVYNVRWAPVGNELLFNRTNRKQNIMEFCAANPATGKCRVIVREKHDTWTDNSPTIQWLENGKFLWFSERNGFDNIYLYDLSGKLLNSVTKNDFEVARIVRVDEAKGVLYYMSHDGEVPGLGQLHRVKLDGTGDVRMTDPKFGHTVSLSDDGKYFIDSYYTVDTPTVTVLRDAKGNLVAPISKADATQFNSLGLKPVKRFAFPAADGSTTCYGTISYPSDFDPSRKYPVLVSVYGGPDSAGGFERFQTPSPLTELGFLVVSMEGRGTQGRGKAFKDAVYGKLGIVEIDDQAAGVRALAQQFPYVDAKRVGIFGTSYGGYASAMCLLRYPDVFAAASCSSSVTDWRNYDTIYTERFMNTPQENPTGYEQGSAMKYARQLKGRMMLYYGTADNNVHPSNTFQLVAALQQAGKSFEVQVGPDQGHSGVNFSRMLEFFIDAIGDKPMRTTSFERAWNRRLSAKRNAE